MFPLQLLGQRIARRLNYLPPWDVVSALSSMAQLALLTPASHETITRRLKEVIPQLEAFSMAHIFTLCAKAKLHDTALLDFAAVNFLRLYQGPESNRNPPTADIFMRVLRSCAHMRYVHEELLNFVLSVLVKNSKSLPPSCMASIVSMSQQLKLSVPGLVAFEDNIRLGSEVQQMRLGDPGAGTVEFGSRAAPSHRIRSLRNRIWRTSDVFVNIIPLVSQVDDICAQCSLQSMTANDIASLLNMLARLQQTNGATFKKLCAELQTRNEKQFEISTVIVALLALRSPSQSFDALRMKLLSLVERMAGDLSDVASIANVVRCTARRPMLVPQTFWSHTIPRLLVAASHRATIYDFGDICNELQRASLIQLKAPKKEMQNVLCVGATKLLQRLLREDPSTVPLDSQPLLYGLAHLTFFGAVSAELLDTTVSVIEKFNLDFSKPELLQNTLFALRGLRYCRFKGSTAKLGDIFARALVHHCENIATPDLARSCAIVSAVSTNVNTELARALVDRIDSLLDGGDNEPILDVLEVAAESADRGHTLLTRDVVERVRDGLSGRWKSLNTRQYCKAVSLLARLSMLDATRLMELRDQLTTWADTHSYALSLNMSDFQNIVQTVTALEMHDDETTQSLRHIVKVFPTYKAEMEAILSRSASSAAIS